jgi:hypothetical protein
MTAAPTTSIAVRLRVIMERGSSVCLEVVQGRLWLHYVRNRVLMSPIAALLG